MGSQQRFCLRWNNHQSNLLNVFDELLQHETLVDVTLACEGQSLKAHKVVLSACSPYFQHLFLDNPCQHPIVILKDVSFTDMKILIDFMYKGEVDISHDQLSTLLTVADNLKVKGLAEVKESMAAQETNSANHYHHQTQSEMSNTQYTRTSPSRDGPSSPKRRKKRRASSVSTTHSDDLDSCGAKEITSRSSTPVELPIVPKTETFDMSYEDEEKPLGTVLENSPPSLLASTNTNSQHSNISHESSSQLAYHLSRPQKDSTTMSRVFETDSGDVDCGLPFTQHLSVDADDTPPSSTPLVLLPSTPLVLLPPTSSTSHTDSSSTCLASTSSLNHTNVASVSSASQSRNLHSQGQRPSLATACPSDITSDWRSGMGHSDRIDIRRNRRSFSVAFKLRVVQEAEKIGVREASEKFNIRLDSILQWLLKKPSLQMTLRMFSDNLESENSNNVSLSQTSTLNCDKCNRVFQNGASLARHLKYTSCSEVVELVICPVCSKHFSRRDSMRRHFHSYHKEFEEAANVHN